MTRHLRPREGTAWECDHLRQVARDIKTGEWRHVDGLVIGSVCTAVPYKVSIRIEGDHTLDTSWKEDG